ncbi:MAG: sugar-binding transcriptional regulator [Geminicoccaceae bacterium]|nr:sugar-binding transcriptional regulator [Geminicoccaceae bacterium]
MARPRTDGAPRDESRRLDLAARAAWLAYIHGQTQDEIAASLGLSRQSVQRLVALAVHERLIKFRLDHPLVPCLALADGLKARFGLAGAEVAPAGGGENPVAGVAVVGAALVERRLESRQPLVVGVGTGRTLRRTVAEIGALERPQHKLVSIVSNMTRDGRVSRFEVAMRLADRIGAACYQMQAPAIAATGADCERMRAQPANRAVCDLAGRADALYVGIGHVGPGAPLHVDDFIDAGELDRLVADGAVGEIAAWPFDREGRILTSAFVARLPGVRPDALPGVPVVGIAAGPAKVAAIRAALKGGLLSVLVTDEPTATALLRD